MDQNARATLKSISRVAGVAVSTVSRALNYDPRISQITRSRIRKIAESANYIPNTHARSLSGRHSGVIALMLGEVTNPFYPELLQHLTHQVAERDLQLMLLPIGAGRMDLAAMKKLMEHGIDGCILAAASLAPDVADGLSQLGTPLVMINRPGFGRACAVWCNNVAAGGTIGRFLLDQGFRNIAYAAGRADESDRERGLRAALAQHGLALSGRVSGTYSYQSGMSMAEQLLSAPERPQAIVGANDIIALGVMEGVRRAGLRVPDDVSVVGMDDIEMASWSSYDLTTVAQPTPQMISRALDLLTQRIADPSLAAEEIHLPGTLRVRSSVRLAADFSESRSMT